MNDFELLCKYNSSKSLINHAKTVEAVMRHFADLNQEDSQIWGRVGLLHDLDYEMFPELHCKKSEEILRQEGYDELIIRAVMSHGFGMCMDVEPKSTLEKTLFTIDELSGLIYAAALMRPTKMEGMEVKSIKKKLKDKTFAAGVNREVITKGVQMMNKELEWVIAECIKAMQKSAAQIGLE